MSEIVADGNVGRLDRQQARAYKLRYPLTLTKFLQLHSMRTVAVVTVSLALSLGASLAARGLPAEARADAERTQEPVINRGAPMTLTGEIVDISCYKQKGVAAGTGAAHADCARVCVRTKGAAVGILSDGDGLFRIWGAMARDKYAKLMPYVGQTVEITGTEVVLSNNYDVRSFDLQTIKAAKRPTGN